MKIRNAIILVSVCFLLSADAQQVTVGKGSYGTVLPSGAAGPRFSNGAAAVPKISPSFSKPVQTCDYWSSLIFPFSGNQHSNVLYAHPLNYKAQSNGLQLGYTTTPVFAAQDYLFPFQPQLTVGVTGLNAVKTMTDDYGDWTVTAAWDDGARTMKATLGHGLPFVYFTVSGGTASVTSISTPTIWYNVQGVIGMTVGGRHYGIFAPDSSVWSGTMTLQSSLNGKNHFSIALLPDNTTQTLEIFRKHAYAFVTGSAVSWNYDVSSAKLTTTFSYTTELKEAKNNNLNQTLTALYRHQWLNTAAPLTNYQYTSVSGPMKVYDGNQFTTALTFEGVIPALPDEGDYQRSDLLAMVNSVAAETLPATGNFAGTYWNGKAIARFAHLVSIADQLGAVAARDHFLSEIKKRLEEWFTAGGPQSYVYNDQWKTLTGYPSEFGADTQINDHNFHAGYAIMGAAIVAQYDSVWAAKENWGGMVDLLIRDGNNYDRSDTRFPFLRAFDPYAGHSWESGHADFGDGNNEESSSESMNFATAVILWGEITRQPEIRDAGIYLYATERTAIEQYWFDEDDAVFPSSYPYKALGMVWGGKGVHSTWFGANPDFIHGINMLPFNGGSFYLGRRPEYAQANYEEVVKELNGAAPTWKDILWHYQALYDPASALSSFFADPSYTPEEGGTKAHTYHWLSNLKKIGRPDPTVTASVPTYSVFKNSGGYKTYIAYNAAADSTVILFSDGFSMKAGARSLRTVNTAPGNPAAPVALLIADKTKGKIPLTVSFTGSKSFDRNGGQLQHLWDFGDGQTSVAKDTVHVFTTPGIYSVVLSVTNTLNFTTKDSVVVSVLGNGTPYSGTPVQVPGIIQAENFDNGGEGVAYHDNNNNNIGLAYRPTEGVDIEAADGGGYDVYWMTSGEWIEYTIQVPADGMYEIIPTVSTVPGFGHFRIFIDNVDVSGKKAVLNTGGWQIWKPVSVSSVQLKAGKRIMRIEVSTDTQSEKTNWLYSLNFIEIKASAVGVGTTATIPEEFSLEQNYPNPFNPSTTIRYHLAAAGPVQLKVFDLLGKEIKTLVSEQQEAGTYAVQYTTDGLPSGMYFYRIRSGSFVSVKSMMLLK